MTNQFEQQNTTEEAIRDFFGDRGKPIEPGKLTFRVIRDTKSDEDWIFIRDNRWYEYSDYNEVELYNSENGYLEVYDGWPRKHFKWNKSSLVNKLKNVIEKI
jgi:hypothetical protein